MTLPHITKFFSGNRFASGAQGTVKICPAN